MSWGPQANSSKEHRSRHLTHCHGNRQNDVVSSQSGRARKTFFLGGVSPFHLAAYMPCNLSIETIVTNISDTPSVS